jgi:hypothetical protein
MDAAFGSVEGTSFRQARAHGLINSSACTNVQVPSLDPVRRARNLELIQGNLGIGKLNSFRPVHSKLKE